ncbi:MAG: hypothetical protein NT051_01005 [Candidatus Micrarchaeota archaeon]|nr:hypothetical protein [Candidatus Micrarchaeota archaeon]
METVADDLPFSARYSLPVQVSQNLSEVSWDTVIQLSSDFQTSTKGSEGKARKVIKELQMTRLILLEKIRESAKDGRIDPKLLVDVVKLLQRCEEVTAQYEIDLKEFSRFIYLISEKLKREKLARHEILAGMGKMVPMKDDLAQGSSKAKRKILPKKNVKK